MKSFEYAAPESLRDATGLLGERWGEAEVLAGGTDLVTCLKQHITQPKRLVSLRKIGALKGIEASGDELSIGAMTPLREAAASEAVRKHFPSIAAAIENIASPQILSTGTVGGDLCQRPRCWYFRNGFGLLAMDGNTSLVRVGDNRYHAIYNTDGPALFVSASSLGPALIALGGVLHAEGPRGRTREIPAAEFFHTPESEQERETALRPNEILTRVTLPLKGLKNATYEVRHRHGLDWPYVTASVAFAGQGGAVRDARVVLGHVAPTPWAASNAARGLEKIDEASAARCAEAAAEPARPLSRNEYKVQLVKAAVKRALLAAQAA